MKAWLSFSLLLLAGTAVAAEPGPSPAERPRLTAELRSRIEAASPTSTRSEATATTGTGAVAMTPFWVVGAATPLMSRLEDEAPKNQPFTWEDGGTLAKRTGPLFTSELKFQYDPRHQGIDLLSFSW